MGSSFVVSFTLPYLLFKPYADLGSQVGFMYVPSIFNWLIGLTYQKKHRYGGIAFLSIVFGYFCIPELKNRSLEEIEKMFEANIPLRKFGEYEDVEAINAEESRWKEDTLWTKLERG